MGLILKHVISRKGTTSDFAINILNGIHILTTFCKCCFASVSLGSGGRSHGIFLIFTFFPHASVGRILQGFYRIKLMLFWVICWACSANTCNLHGLPPLNFSCQYSIYANAHQSWLPHTLAVTVLGLFREAWQFCAKMLGGFVI